MINFCLNASNAHFLVAFFFIHFIARLQLSPSPVLTLGGDGSATIVINPKGNHRIQNSTQGFFIAQSADEVKRLEIFGPFSRHLHVIPLKAFSVQQNNACLFPNSTPFDMNLKSLLV